MADKEVLKDLLEDEIKDRIPPKSSSPKPFHNDQDQHVILRFYSPCVESDLVLRVGAPPPLKPSTRTDLE